MIKKHFIFLSKSLIKLLSKKKTMYSAETMFPIFSEKYSFSLKIYISKNK